MSTLKVSTLRNEADSSDVAINRITSDGNIVTLQKDGTAVGSIGTGYGVVDIKGGSAGLLMGNAAVLPVNGSGTLTDGSYNVGASSFRFNDLYLSGGVYVGGTGSANYLDDYEEGTFTPTLTSGMSYTSVTASRYTKIGRQVTVQVRLIGVTQGSASAGDDFTISLPFTVDGTRWAGNIGEWYTVNIGAGTTDFVSAIAESDDKLKILRFNLNGGGDAMVNADAFNGDYLGINITYFTDA